MTRDKHLSVLYKHGEKDDYPKRISQKWSLARPNADHKPMGQDEIRETAMRYLIPEQRSHFQLNPKLNRGGNLFGPERDEVRQNPPILAKDQPSISPVQEVDGNRPIWKSISECTRISKKSGISINASTAGATSAFPNTIASIRGSDVTNDLKELASIVIPPTPLPSTCGKPTSAKPHQQPSKPVFTLDKLKMSNWIKLEQKGCYYGKRKHFLRIINTLDYDEKIVEVVNYQLLRELVEFYSENYNSNAHAYQWKDIWGNTLELHKTLGENGLMDRSRIIDNLGIDHFPTILLYFKDGFENEPPMRLDITNPEPDGVTIPCRNY